MKTDIRVICDFETTQKLDDVLKSRGLIPFDLKHLPFNEFLYITEVNTQDIDVEDLRRSFAHVPKDRFDEIIKSMRKNQADRYDCKVVIENDTIRLDDSISRIDVKFKATSMLIDHDKFDIGDVIESFTIDTYSEEAMGMLRRNPDTRSTLEEGACKLFFSVLTTLMYSQLPKEYKDIIDFSPKKEVKASTTYKKKGKKVTYIRNTVYRPIVNTTKYNEFIESRGYTRHTEAWYQSGHWRTYKSGKRVWINPIVKKAKGLVVDSVEQTYKVL